jgi:Mg2+-importing ATPase
VSFVDTLKKTTKETIAAAQKLHVALTIITGDSVRVAEAVGRETGLVCAESEVVEASAFLALPNRTQRERAKSIRVFARTTPEQKLELIELLKETATIGFLGEGINDAPALKAAHVSMVVESASDVARETADIILLESDLSVIVDGIRLGRETHANTLKYIRTTLISNFGNFYSVSMGSLFITFLPMLPKQILLLNLLSDFPMMAIAYDRVSVEEVQHPQRYDFRSLYIIFVTLGLVSTLFDFMWFGLFYRISPEVLQTNWFIASVITEILLIFSIRSMLPIEKAGLPARSITILSGGAFVIALAIPLIPVTARFFEFTPPSAMHLSLIVTLSLVYLLTTELLKRPLMRFLETRRLA